MVAASRTQVDSTEKIQALGIPVIDLSCKRSLVSELVVKACEDYGFFKVVNHGVPSDIIARMEAEGFKFFAQPAPEKQNAGPPNPLGYGCKNIGFNGDIGEVEYLLLDINPMSIAQRSRAICKDHTKYCCVVNDYVGAVKGLACQILELLAEGLRIQDKRILSRMIKDGESDSLLRLNHYPSSTKEPQDMDRNTTAQRQVGFGEHSDPQILTLLWSNDVDGLQILAAGGIWVPILPDPSAFYFKVGDVLQAFTNDRFVSVRHRVMVNNSFKSRIAMMYFGAPPPHARISPRPELITPQNPCLYRPFTWIEYKNATYSLRLGDNRLNLFSASSLG